jgi:hypothetical protein
MKRTTQIMPIGSSTSATIPAKPTGHVGIIYCLTMLVAAFALTSCDKKGDDGLDLGGQKVQWVNNYQPTATVETWPLVHLEVAPMGEPSQFFLDVDLRKLANDPLVLKSSVEVKGQMAAAVKILQEERTFATDKNTGPFFGDVIAIAQNNFSPARQYTRPMVKTRLDMEGNFSLVLTQGENYFVIVNPHGLMDEPPITTLISNVSDPQAVTFAMPVEPTFVSGKIVVKDENLLAKLATDAKVRLFRGRRLVSATSKINGDGSFRAKYFDPSLNSSFFEPLTLYISSQSSDIQWPMFRHEITKPQEGLAELDLGVIALGDLNGPLSRSFAIKGDDQVAVPGAFVLLGSNIGKGEVISKRQADGGGNLLVSGLLEGTYDVAIIPPPQNEFGLKVLDGLKFKTGEPIDTLEVNLQRRSALEAHIKGPDGSAIEGVQVEFMRVGKIGAFATEDIFEDMLLKRTAISNSLGQVCRGAQPKIGEIESPCDALLLDAGKYLAHLIPPVGSVLAQEWMEFDFPEQNSFEINLKNPQLIKGRIVGPQGKPRKAYITTYLAQHYTSTFPRVIGNTISDDEGVFMTPVSLP